MITIAYVAGEASGDRHAAALHAALVAARPASDIPSAWGIGGRCMSSAGIDLLVDSSRWGAIGVVESLRGVGKYIAAMSMLKAELLKRKPSALILVDFGYFNVRLARWARKAGIGPIVYYMPPGSWKRRASPKASQELGALCDLIVTPFSWSNENLRAAGANSHWLGHPLVDIVKPELDVADFDRKYAIDAARPIVALLPGSRTAEVENILPMMLRAAAIVTKRVPGTQFLLAAAPNLDRSMLERMVSVELSADRDLGDLKPIAAGATDVAQPAAPMVTNEGFVLKPAKPGAGDQQQPWQTVRRESRSQTPTIAIVENLAYDCMARSDLVITASGTATLEAAILNRPMIIVYRGSKLMELEYHLRKSRLGIEFIGLPNIIAGRKIVPELTQDDASPEAVADLAIEHFIEPHHLMAARDVLSSVVRPALGEPGVIERAAGVVWRVIRGSVDGDSLVQGSVST
jgi:lipid-A-disaccharide synthase